MLPSATAFDLFVLSLAVGFIAALFGWAGGMGGRLSYSFRVERVERTLEQLLNRSKGQAGQAKTQETRVLQQSRMAEAQALIAQHMAKTGRKQELREEDLLKIAAQRGLVMSGKGEGEQS
jgi:hypothetical protein